MATATIRIGTISSTIRRAKMSTAPKGSHFIQEDSPDPIGEAIADWYRGLDR